MYDIVFYYNCMVLFVNVRYEVRTVCDTELSLAKKRGMNGSVVSKVMLRVALTKVGDNVKYS